MGKAAGIVKAEHGKANSRFQAVGLPYLVSPLVNGHQESATTGGPGAGAGAGDAQEGTQTAVVQQKKPKKQTEFSKEDKKTEDESGELKPGKGDMAGVNVWTIEKGAKQESQEDNAASEAQKEEGKGVK